jgi:hypothetical protein
LKKLPISVKSWYAIARLFVAAVLITHIFFLWTVRSQIARGDPDFTVFYTAAKMIRNGLGPELYNLGAQLQVQQQFAHDPDVRRGALPYIHPPFEALLFTPLTMVGYDSAFLIWTLLNLLILIAVCWFCRDMLPVLKQLRLWESALLCLAFFPVLANFHQGQDAIFLVLMVTLALRSIDRDAPVAAGFWLGTGIFKYHLVLPLFFILAVWKGRKLVWGFLLSSFAALLISLWIVGWQGVSQYPYVAWSVVSEPSLGGLPFRRLPNLAGLIGGLPLSSKWVWVQRTVILLSSAALILTVTRFQRFSAGRKSRRLCIASAVITAVLVAYSTNTYDLCLLIPALAIIAEYVIAESPRPMTLKNLGFVVPIFFLCLSPLWFFLWMRWERINLMAIFLLGLILAIRNALSRLGENKRVSQQVVVV